MTKMGGKTYNIYWECKTSILKNPPQKKKKKKKKKIKYIYFNSLLWIQPLLEQNGNRSNLF